MRVDEIKSLLAEPSLLRESLTLEFKEAGGGLPHDVWETYCAFANTIGGTIVLGVREDKDTHNFTPVGVPNPEAIEQDFWDAVRNPQRVSSDVLPPRAVSVFVAENGMRFVSIEVPRANRFVMPIEVYDRRRKGFVAYVRRGEADHVATDEELNLFRYDATRDADCLALPDVPLDALNMYTVERYRRVFDAAKPTHPWRDDSDEDFLYHLSATARDQAGELHPTQAGLLAFGNEFEIVHHFPYFFLDYREQRNDVRRWEDRLYSASGEWSGNLVDFYLDVMNRLDHAIATPFTIDARGYGHTTGNPVKDAVNEALANALVHAYYGGSSTVKAILKRDALEVSNSGSFVIERGIALAGGTSEPRNPALMRIFAHIGRLDRAGSGLNAIWRTCREEFGVEPILEETFSPAEVKLRVPLTSIDGVVESNGGGSLSDDDKTATATIPPLYRHLAPLGVDMAALDRRMSSLGGSERILTILRFLEERGGASRNEVAEALSLSQSRTGEVLRELVFFNIVERSGSGRNTRYRTRME